MVRIHEEVKKKKLEESNEEHKEAAKSNRATLLMKEILYQFI